MLKLTIMDFSQYTAKKIEEVFDVLKSSPNGLSEAETANRLKIYGLNEIKEKKVDFFNIFGRQFKSPFFYLLFVASLIALLVGEKVNGLLILLFVIINVSLGFFQEAKAQKVIFSLKKYLPSKTEVLRENTEKIIEKNLLVPGDIVLLKMGDIAPADIRITEIKNLLVDESALTGESLPVAKISQSLRKETKEIFKAENIVFSGTAVVSGEAQGVVINTAENTVFGSIIGLTDNLYRKSAYEKNLLKFSRFILITVLVTILLIFFAHLFIRGAENYFDFLIFSIALIVSIIPEALPLIIIFTLSQGALKLARKKVVVKRLAAIEDLGNMEILCTDKTGTLTENKLVLERILAEDKEKCLRYGLFSSIFQGPFDAAILNHQIPAEMRSTLENIRIIAKTPFDPIRLRDTVLIQTPAGEKILITKGTPERLLKLSSKIEGFSKEFLEKELIKDGKEGKRVLAVAFKEFLGEDLSENDEKNLTFLGYFSFDDPLKPTSQETFQLAKKLGIKIKILTGDRPETAGFVAKKNKLIENPQQVITGETLESLSNEEFEKKCEEFSVFARVSPQMKYKIVKQLSEKHEVGFLGDGINDVPALKIAHLGIVVDSAVDVTKEATDLVLLQKDLGNIIEGIKEGRNIFANINKYLKVTLSNNFGNFYSLAIISLFVPFLPMLPTQIILVNLLSDFPLLTIVSDSADPEELRKPKMYQLNKFIVLIIFLALFNAVCDLAIFGIFHKAQPALIQTLWFIESILTEIVIVYSIRTSRFFLKAKRPHFLLLAFSFISVFLAIYLPFSGFGQVLFNFIRPSSSALLIILFLVLAYFIAGEITKLLYFKYLRKRDKVGALGFEPRTSVL